MTRTEVLKKGYKCRCGRKHRFSAWVFGHYGEEITHACDCGRTNVLREGKVKAVIVGAVLERKRPVRSSQ